MAVKICVQKRYSTIGTKAWLNFNSAFEQPGPELEKVKLTRALLCHYASPRAKSISNYFPRRSPTETTQRTLCPKILTLLPQLNYNN